MEQKCVLKRWVQETIFLLISGSGKVRENCWRVRRQSNAVRNVNQLQAVSSFSISAPVACKGENHLLLLGFDFSDGETCSFLQPRFRFFAESRTPSGICHLDGVWFPPHPTRLWLRISWIHPAPAVIQTGFWQGLVENHFSLIWLLHFIHSFRAWKHIKCSCLHIGACGWNCQESRAPLKLALPGLLPRATPDT